RPFYQSSTPVINSGFISNSKIIKKTEFSRKCVLCGEKTTRWLYSPITFFFEVSTYFKDLIGLTSEQRNKCDMFMRNKFRVLLCSNHIKRPV
ncbi:hypothetical protein PMAYCL1PPCAC_22452, partial [Pristionchus mayeri]